MRVVGSNKLEVNPEVANALVSKQPHVVTVEFTLKDEKKNSVRYDSSSDDPAVTSAYVMKNALPKPYPRTFKMQLIFD